MKKKTVSGLLPTLLLLGMLTLAFNIQSVKLEDAIRTVNEKGLADFSMIQEATTSTIDVKYDWSMFRNDLRHTGYSVASPVHYSPVIELKWIFEAPPAHIFSSPIIADVNADGRSEIVVGSTNKNVYCLDTDDGSLLWRRSMGGAVTGSPAAADINDDDKLEVVVGSRDGKIYALRGESGSLLWSYQTDYQIGSSPAIADINRDGKLEVVIGSGDEKIYALRGENGSLLWSYATSGTVWSSPAIVDVDRDDRLEVVVGSSDWHVYALNGEDGSLLWRYYTAGGVIDSSPAVADLDNDSQLEVVVGGGYGWIYVLKGANGQLLRSYRTGRLVLSSPAIADVNSDGELDIVVGSHDNKVYALRGVDCSKLWDFATGGVVDSSPSIADINGDGELEVVVGSWDGNTYFLRGKDGSVLWSFFTRDVIRSNPAIADINDGKLVIVVGAHYSSVYAFQTMSPVASATIYADPATLNLKSKGQWITAYIQLPEEYDTEDIDVATILLSETIQPVLDPKYDFVTNSSEYHVDHDGDGSLERMVKFNRTEVASWIRDDLGIQYGNVTLMMTGELLDGTPFEGTVVIRVLFPGDVDGDGYVGSADAGILNGAYGTSGEDPLYVLSADFDEDDYIGSADEGILNGNYGNTAS